MLLNGATSSSVTGGDLLVVFNADETPQQMTLPASPAGATWGVLFDTSLKSPPRTATSLAAGTRLAIRAQSTVLLESRVP